MHDVPRLRGSGTCAGTVELGTGSWRYPSNSQFARAMSLKYQSIRMEMRMRMNVKCKTT
jgi:hypothetical protein